MASGDPLEKRVEALGQIAAKIKATSSLEFTAKELRTLRINIKQCQFGGTRKETTLDPCFFDPYPPHLLSPPEPDDEREYPEYHPNDGSDPIDNAGALIYYLGLYLDDYKGLHRGVKFDAFHEGGWHVVHENRWREVNGREPYHWFVEGLASHVDAKSGKSH